MPEIFRRLHPQFKTPWLPLVVFAGIAPILVLLPGDVNFVGTLYSFGATLSFTVAHASLVRLRMKQKGSTETLLPGATEPHARRGRVAAVRDRRRARHRSLVPRHRGAEPDDPLGRARLDRARASRSTCIYRRRFVLASLRDDRQGAARVRAGARARVPAAPRPDRRRPAVRRRARRRLQPRCRARRTDRRAHRARGAARPAARRRPARSSRTRRTSELDEAIAIGDSYGIRVLDRLVRARSAGAAIVEEAERRGTEIIVHRLAAQVAHRRRSAPSSAATVDHVLRQRPVSRDGRPQSREEVPA